MLKSLFRQFGSGLTLALFFTVLVASLSLNVIIGLKYRALFEPHDNGIKVGSSVLKAVPVLDVDGKKQVITADSNRPSVLYIMSPTCVWCARNLENIRSLAKQSSGRYNFVGLSLTSIKLKEYLASTPLPFTVRLIDSKEMPKDIDMSSTPTPEMVVLDAKGKVEKVWTGALDGKRKSEVESFFHVSLPGTASASIARQM